jgi:hypothetical protein
MIFCFTAYTATVEARTIVFGFEQLSTTTKNTFIDALTRLHRATTIRKSDPMKRKRPEGHDHVPYY